MLFFFYRNVRINFAFVTSPSLNSVLLACRVYSIPISKTNGIINIEAVHRIYPACYFSQRRKKNKARILPAFSAVNFVIFTQFSYLFRWLWIFFFISNFVFFLLSFSSASLENCQSDWCVSEFIYMLIASMNMDSIHENWRLNWVVEFGLLH